MSVWFKSRLNPWYIWIPSNPNLYSTKIIMKMRWQTIASNVSIRTISPTATPLPKAYDCVAVYIAGRRTSLVVYGWWPQPPTKKLSYHKNYTNLNQYFKMIKMSTSMSDNVVIFWEGQWIHKSGNFTLSTPVFFSLTCEAFITYFMVGQPLHLDNSSLMIIKGSPHLSENISK